MRWPWVSRLAYELAIEERNRLRGQVDQLLAHVQRMDRVEHGLNELAAERKPPSEPMPEEIHEEIQRWGSPATQQRLIDEAWEVYRKTRSWDVVAQRLRNGIEGAA
jgi:hypothetical protein